MGKIRKLFTEKRKVMSQKSISDLTGSSTPVESSDYIESFLERKERFLPPINFATASNFAKFGSAKQYSVDAVSRVYGTYPYDGSLAEKIDWHNRSNFYDLYIFNNRYPRTCGYAVMSPEGWGSLAAGPQDDFGLSDSPEYIQLKGGPHADPNSGSLSLSRQFPTPYDGKANIYDPSSITRESNLALDLNKGVTVEFWFKGTSDSGEQAELDSKTTRQVYFDLWNGKKGTTEGDSQGRLIIYSVAGGDTYATWTSGSEYADFTLSSEVNSALRDGEWHHIAVTAKVVPRNDTQVKIEWNDFLDGQWVSAQSIQHGSWGGGGFYMNPASLGAVTGSMIANIGAARIPGISPANVASAVASGYGDGWGKVSGSFDEFRYWKTARTPEEISRFWFTQIAGGTNTDNKKFSQDEQPVDLGVYYKFNEGNTGNEVVDATVLDYSGRITNGTWNGYITGSSRIAGDTASAMIESSASISEFRDPIIYSSHPDVSSLYTLLSEEGESWDLKNNMALYHTMPEWITTEDQDFGGEQLKKLTQIVASYLDTLYLQISAITTIKDKKYPYSEIINHNPNIVNGSKTETLTYSNAPIPFAKSLLDDSGLYSSEIFAMANDLAALANRDEYQDFEQSLNDIKNTIYQNIYNNLDYILKSKGTEKSFRNLIRCYGVDDELIKINLYASDATYSFNDADYRSTAIKKKYIDFNEADRNQSTIYQSASISTSNSISYIPGWNPENVDSAGTTGSAMTFEADVIFPKKFPRNHPSNLWYNYPYLTSSVFGCHTAQPTVSSPEDFSYPTGDSASFSVYTLRDQIDSETVRFMLSSSNGEIPNLTTNYFQDVYDNQRWLFAVKVRPSSPLESQEISGSTSQPISGSWQLEFKGYNPILDQIDNSFSLETELSAEVGTYFMNANKRVFAGAERQDFSGSLQYYSDVKIGALRVWDDNVDDFDLMAHAKDPTSYGRSRAYRSAYLFDQPSTASLDTTYIPEFETLLLNWDFNQITGSTSGVYLADHYGGSAWNGSFEISNYASGSDEKWEVPARYKYHYTGRGDWFLPEDTTSLVDLNFLSAVKTNLPEVSSGEDMISILDTDDDLFVRDSRPVNHYFAIEKSMAAVISEQMLNMFATTLEFNNLVGEPVNRYRMEYKSLGKMREAFFRKVGNNIDFNKFIDFYKWVDDSLSDMLEQLVPMSANFSDGVKNMIESHILERNKYWTKFPTLELKAEPIVGRLKGINELAYDWEHGHAPLKTKATCTIDITTDDPAQLDNRYFTITSTDGTARKYVFDEDSSGATGTVKDAGPPVEIWVQISGMSADEDFEAQFAAAINSANGHNGKIKATVTADGILLEQTLAGPEGNTVIDSNLGGAHYTATLHGGGGADGFINGSNEEQNNCHWWQQRSEASASFVAGNQVDTDRNVLRRILTSETTTNKILATGEYTDPVDYPNSGFPNAAEINLAQSGTFGSRTQYKGSTYALRRFSKPYRLEAQRDIQLHGGINSPDNQRREATKTAAQNMINSNTAFTNFLYNTPADTDDLKDCDDVLAPNQKRYHAFAIYPAGTTPDEIPFAKGTHFAPFNLVSSSATTNSSMAELDIDVVNLHTDGYGDTSEIPMQGPFTERHVGGMAHRHHDISDGSHSSANRSELFRLRVSSGVNLILAPGNRENTGIYKSAYAFDQFYRDGVAKRPVNIKNILTTTDTEMSQSALGNYDNSIQILNTHNQGGMFLAKMQASTGSDGWYGLNSPSLGLVVSDTADTPKVLAVGQTLLNAGSGSDLVHPFNTSQFNPYLSKNNITERFSAPGDPSTAGDAFGGFGIDKETNKYSVYNALPWRNRQVRFPTNALLTAHCDAYGAFSGSTLSAVEASTATTASFHKTHRNTAHVLDYDSTLTAFRENSVELRANAQYAALSPVESVDNLRKMTISIWFKNATASSATIKNLFAWDSRAVVLLKSGKINFSIVHTPDASTTITFSTNDIIKDDTWHHLAIAFDQGEAQSWRTATIDYSTLPKNHKFFPKFWVDGKPVSVTVSGAHLYGGYAGANMGNLIVGNTDAGVYTNPWNGYVEDVSLWSDVLSDEQVQDLYLLPNYDSHGPGDLSTLDYVSTDPQTNILHAWWLFNQATSDMTDSAPIGNNITLTRDATGAYLLHNTTENEDYLPAYYYGIYCGERNDNYYVQHPIPINEFGYSWITASADHSEGCELLTTASFITASLMGSSRAPGASDPIEIFYGFEEGIASTQEFIPVDFAGLNINIYEPVSSSQNVLGYPAFVDGFPHPAGSVYDQYLTTYAGGIVTNIFTYGNYQKGGILNGILLHRNGPYGYPSWKQTRGGNHPIIREHKKTNIFSTTTESQRIVDSNKRAETVEFLNHVEQPVSIAKPMIHRVDSVSNGKAETLTLKHTYNNNLVSFANKSLDRAIINPNLVPERQVYDDLKDMYLAGDEDAGTNPLKSFKSLLYRQPVFPKAENTFSSGSRARLEYSETDQFISESKNGEYRTFWRDELSDRRRDEGALNSLGYPIYSDINQATVNPTEHQPYALGSGTLSIWPLDAGNQSQAHLVGTAIDGLGYLIASCSIGTTSQIYIPQSGDEFGGTWGELTRDPNATLFASLSTAKLDDLNNLTGDYEHFMSDDFVKATPTASQCIDHYDLGGLSYADDPNTAILGGYPLVARPGILGASSVNPWGKMGSGIWTTNYWAGRNPWYDSYDAYSEDLRAIGKEYSILPEFKISEHIPFYISAGGFKNIKNSNFLSIDGGSISSSASPSGRLSFDESFFKEYSHSDFMREFELIQDEHESIADASLIMLQCKAIKKLLPYNGFYPVQRCLQLGALMSSSFAKHLSGSSQADYTGPEEHTAERLQSFLQPFYAPGIMYNSIKSGIAVDYPIHTSSAEISHIVVDPSLFTSVNSGTFGGVNSVSSSHHVVMSNPDYRIPFEALISPSAYIPATTDREQVSTDPLSGDASRIKMFLTAPYYGSSSFYAQWLGNSSPHYEMAINNFASEVPNFFLKNRSLTTFTSEPQSKFIEFKSGTTYYMDVSLEKSPDFMMNHHLNPQFRVTDAFSNQLVNGLYPDNSVSIAGAADFGSMQGWGFGPKYHVTGTIDEAYGALMYGNTVTSASVLLNSLDPSFSVHSPPYIYGRSTARLSFVPHEVTEMAEGEALNFSLEKIIENLKSDNIEYMTEEGVGHSLLTRIRAKALQKIPEDPNTFAAKENIMRITSSVNLFGSTYLPEIEYDAQSRTAIAARSPQVSSDRAWVIHTKWESPVLDFAKGTGGGNSFIVRGDSALELEDITDIEDFSSEWWQEGQSLPANLKRSFGMWKGYGQLPSSDSGITLSLKESFPELSLEPASQTGSLIRACGFQAEQSKIGEIADYKMISEAVVAVPFLDVEGERKFFALGNSIIESRTLLDQALTGQDGPGHSIVQMASKLGSYVLPPHMDFLYDTTIEPFAMYIFEFTHRLSKEDLSNIWQNVMPDIGVTAEKATSRFFHRTGENEFFRGNKIPDNTRWMVFKVKKRAATNYFKMTADARDNHNFKFDFSEPGDVERYNYNWPYDFFSLVELAQVENTIVIGDDGVPKPPEGHTTLSSGMASVAAPSAVPPTIANPNNIQTEQLGSLTSPALSYETGKEQESATKLFASKSVRNLLAMNKFGGSNK